MNYLKLRCYNAIRAEQFGKPLSATDRLILRRSRPHVHTEIQFSERYDGISFSATLQDNANGCRFKQIDYTRYPWRWDTLYIPVDEEQELSAYARAKDLEGRRYDLIGLLSFATELNIVKPDPDMYWCSETGGEILKVAKQYVNFRPDSFTPTGLFFEVLYRLTL